MRLVLDDTLGALHRTGSQALDSDRRLLATAAMVETLLMQKETLT
ncbi:hypothetical protein [Ruegeria profundi]|nr:hypothetical protein [Ruegeria profundi]